MHSNNVVISTQMSTLVRCNAELVRIIYEKMIDE